MKRIALVLAASVLLPAATFAQAPPNNPNPRPSDDVLWNRVMELPRGQPIVVVNSYGPPLHCRFDGATDAFLFCYPPDAPPDAVEDYRFDRARVLDVTATRPRVIQHPGVLASAAIAGIVFGLGSTRTLKNSDAVTVGLFAATVVGSAGYGTSRTPNQGLAFDFIYHPRRFGFRRPGMRRFAPHIP
ncbi:MAG TPA: hypothetical protein VGR47_12055 [Terracidiphilus sp.]|nr:hypothetical protein [Terracidiphilus sp.]